MIPIRISTAKTNEQKQPEKYKLGAKISEGAFGTVFRAVNVQTNQQVAVKQIFKSSDRQKTNPIDREISIMRRLNDRHIVRLLEIEQRQFKTHIVMEHCEHDLSQLILSLEYPLPSLLPKFLLYQLLQAVAYIHSLGILHRDIKPSNVLLTEDLQLKLCDFGSAVEISEKVAKGEFDIEGFTKWYKAPEILFGDRKYSTGVDIWSVGCVFAEIYNGVPLFTGANEIEQLVRISDLLGSPDTDNWPGIIKLPDYGKIMFNKKYPRKFQEYFDNWGKEELQILKLMVRYEGRPSAAQLLKHSYFNGLDTKQKFGVRWKKRLHQQPYFSYQRLLKGLQHS